MFGLTSRATLVVAVLLAVVPPAVLVWLYIRRRTVRATRSRVTVGVGVVVLTVLAQVGAVAGVFLVANNQFGFYSSWRDLLGVRSDDAATIDLNGTLASSSGGRLRVLSVDGRASHTRAEALVWLPPQYDEPAYRHHRFPVVEFLPGQPEQPAGVFRGFGLGTAAAHAIASHQAPPFVLVVPPIMVRPPSDTECTNIPHGPQALSWLTTDVPRAVTRQLRVQAPGRHWSVMGWSTGGYCAAKLVYSQVRHFPAAVSLGGYYQPDTQNTWPNLFGGRVHDYHVNSPQWLYAHRSSGLTARLLVVGSRQDDESWASTRRMLAATRDNPDVSHVVLSHGGHNFPEYRPYVGVGLRWLAGTGALA